MTVVVELPLATCGAGHRLGPNQVLVGWLGCTCALPARGHRTYQCRTRGCRHVTYDPPHIDHRQSAAANEDADQRQMSIIRRNICF